MPLSSNIWIFSWKIVGFPFSNQKEEQTNNFTFIISAFFGVYSMAVDTLFLCFLEDLERNDGSAEKPYYMSK